MDAPPVGRWSAPGRVNLIGEHLDYNGGPVLPIAIDRRTDVKARLRDDGRVRAWSDLAEHSIEFGADVEPGEVTDWGAYVAGVVWSLREAGHPVPGADVVISSDVPTGAGLSSSAAIECGVAAALLGSIGVDVPPVEVALLAQRAENDYVGVPSGSMDQLAAMCGAEGHALFIDTAATPPKVDPVPADWTADGLRLLVIDTRASHSLADGEYAKRRAECDTAAEQLGLKHLADAGLDAVLRIEDPVIKARVRHVITETARTRSAVRALRERQWNQLATLFTASHASLRDDFEVSAPELDIAVDASLEAGALGARMTGGGFGGSAIALVPADRAEAVGERVRAMFAHAEFAEPRTFMVAPAAGARRDG
ncbi:galactokinase [Solicola gregarius]|uniref:Galactokinase n=1 Tax=Solicola gregarius TaxID=2908642 RepID=A0AA46TF44_9ACTN|nr:galactokinase [Solicola gregarius]UYM03936.1 galactokinase [Solicola gregarius]